MQLAWTKGLKTPEEKEERIDLIKRGSPVLDVLHEILESKIVSPKKGDYDKASWPYYRADLDGYNRALSDVIGLIKPDKGN